MARPRTSFADKVARSKARIEAGMYEAPGVLDAIFSRRRTDTILRGLNACPVGNGNQFRDATAELLSSALREVIDPPLVKTEFQCHGGRGDIELPLKLEVLPAYPLWAFLAQRHRATSILVEAKNEKDKTDTAAVQQLESYLTHAGRGGLGFLVSRQGFTESAFKQLTHVATLGDRLIIPFTAADLGQVAKARRDGPVAVMEYVRRKHTTLLQRAG